MKESAPLRIDIHAHIAHFPTLKKSEEMVLESQKIYGIRFSLISDCDASEYPSFLKYGYHHVSMFTALRRCVTLAKKYPDRIGVLFWVNPSKEEITPALLRYIEENKNLIYGMKVHPYESHIRMNDKRLLPFFELARKMHWPILVHTAKDEYSDIRYLAMAAKKNPDLLFIAAHLNLLEESKARSVSYMKKLPNLYADTAWVKMKHAKTILEKVGPSRVFFGTDNPIDGLYTLSNPIYLEYFSNKEKLPEEEYRSLMGELAKKVFKLPC